MVEHICLRPERAEDERLLFDLYASTRQEELELTGWDARTRAAFLDMQFNAMRSGYRAMFPTAEFSIVLCDAKEIGRMVVHRTNQEIRVVDLVLLPDFRNRRIGTLLMQRVCDEAARSGKKVTLSVLKNSRPVGWYRRLGFSTVSEAGIYEEMERLRITPASSTG